jgi:hypothetical protein
MKKRDLSEEDKRIHERWKIGGKASTKGVLCPVWAGGSISDK